MLLLTNQLLNNGRYVISFPSPNAGNAMQDLPAAEAAAAPAAPAAAAVINAKAVERLNAMGAHLRSLKAFTVNADVTVEEVLDSGQKVETANSVEIAARLPNKLRVHSTSATRSRKVFYDGKRRQYLPPAEIDLSRPLGHGGGDHGAGEGSGRESRRG